MNNNQQNTFYQTHNVGDVVDCTIERIDPAGVYTDMGGIKGIIHLSQIDGMNMAFKDKGLQNGQRIKAKIVGMNGRGDNNPNNVSLSILSMIDSAANPGATGEDMGGVASTGFDSDGEKFGATDANHKKGNAL